MGTNTLSSKAAGGGQNRPASVELDEDYSVALGIAKFFHVLLGKKYYPALKGVAGVSGIGAAIALAVMLNFGRGISNVTALAGRAQYLLPFFACVIVLYFTLSMITIPSDSACSNCKEPFRMLQEERYFIDRSQTEGQNVRNYRVLKKCNKCGRKQVYPYTEEEDTPS